MKLLPHQIRVLEQTEGLQNEAHYLDMGLGKTFTGSEALIRHNKDVNLVICQKSKIKDWMDHFYQNYDLLVFDLTKKKEMGIFFKHALYGDRVIGIINYELVWRRKELLDLQDFGLLLDESSLIQNSKAKRTKFILKLKPSNVILLSGTPSSGKYENLWTQVRLLGWNISEKVFNSVYVNWKQIQVADARIWVVDKDDPYKNVSRLKRKLSEHGAVFLKTDEVMDLPDQVDIPVMVERSKEYMKFTRDQIITVDGHELVGDTVLTKRLYQRMLCGHYSKEKLEAVKDIIDSTKDRLVIFYNFTDELLALLKVCEDREVGIINGDHKDDPKGKDILLIQYQAGSMGLNLQDFGNRILYFTPPERSELMEQSRKRIHRIGQTKTCFYYFLLVKDSIETTEIIPTLNIRKEWNDGLFEK